MTDSNTVKKKRKQKNGKSEQVQKPYKSFPLTPHRTNRWCKKRKHSDGRSIFYYFGPLDDWQGALAKYERDWPYIVQEIDPPEVDDDPSDLQTPDPSDSDDLKVGGACYLFLDFKKSELRLGEISDRSYKDYHQTCRRVMAALGKHKLVKDLTPDDFQKFRIAIREVRGPVSSGNEIQRVRTVFKYCLDIGRINSPVKFGPGFKKPSKRVLRLHRQKRDAEHGKRMFESAELCRILDALDGNVEIEVLKNGEPTGETEKIAADPVLKAMVLLGINCAFGQSDLANLPKTALNFETGWVDYPRPKTGVERRCKLWSETIEALKVAIQVRPKAKKPENENMVFLTKYGNLWVRTSDNENPENRVAIDAVTQQFGKLVKKLAVNGKRNFYCLRRGFETIGGASLDQISVDQIMGHADNSMASLYRQGISDERLVAVTNHVHGWLWPPDIAGPG